MQLVNSNMQSKRLTNCDKPDDLITSTFYRKRMLISTFSMINKLNMAYMFVAGVEHRHNTTNGNEINNGI